MTTIDAPLIRRREGGFGGLFRIIVEQQVSVPSAQAILARCQQAVDTTDPDAVIALGQAGLCDCGLSRPKARHIHGLADSVVEGRLNLPGLKALNDEEATDYLLQIKGVGPWTAAIYLLFCEGRVDIWPVKDVALKAAYNAAANSELSQLELDEMASDWAPHRGIAAHVLWTFYAHIRGRTPI